MRGRLLRIAGPLGWLLLLAGACGPTTIGIVGISCEADSDCNPGLKCLPYEGFTDTGDGGCSSAGKQCLMPCKADADCQSIGPGLVCFSACGTPTCEVPGMLGVPTVGASEAGVEASGEAASDAPIDAPVE